MDLADAQTRVETWCTAIAGQRVHGTIQARPIEVFAQHEAGALLVVPPPYDVPILKTVKVHRDYHIEIARALYSAPKDYIGQYLDVRVDSGLVKLFNRGQLVKVHPRQRPGGRFTDPGDLPAAKVGYAMRDLVVPGVRYQSVKIERAADHPTAGPAGRWPAARAGVDQAPLAL